jgi:hypothetical protein
MIFDISGTGQSLYLLFLKTCVEHVEHAERGIKEPGGETDATPSKHGAKPWINMLEAVLRCMTNYYRPRDSRAAKSFVFNIASGLVLQILLKPWNTEPTESGDGR